MQPHMPPHIPSGKTRLHGTAITFGDEAVLIRGAPGSGKSSLALRLMDAEGFGVGDVLMRAMLVSDDQVEIHRTDATLIVAPPAPLAGLLEIRGLGIISVNHKPNSRLVLVVDLVSDAAVERLPDKSFETVEVEGVKLPAIKLGISDSAAVAKLRAALGLLRNAVVHSG
jgi:HPr kinase/phosphorylase